MYKNKLTKMIISTLILCNLLAISSLSWISLWIFMEVTTYIFLASSIDQMENKNKFEFLLTYFLVSFISSAMLLVSMFVQMKNSMNMLSMNLSEIEFSSTQFIMLSIAFLLKIGSIPFHTWVFSVMENMKWKTMVILSTIQKIIPIWALMFFSNLFLLMIVIMLSMLVIMFIPLKAKSVYYFMAASATNNVIWIFLSMLSSPLTTLIYTTIYFTLTINLIQNFKKNNMKMLNQNFYSMATIISMFSVMGIPPLLGFIPKINTIMSILYSNEMILFILIFMVISNSMTTIMYMKPVMSSLTLSLKNLSNKNIYMKKNYLLSMLIHLSWPIIIPIIYLIN